MLLLYHGHSYVIIVIRDWIVLESIYVSIAAYMDDSKNVIETINNLLSKAEYPNRVRFGVCFQGKDRVDLSNIPNVIHTVYTRPSEPFGVSKSRSLLKDMCGDEDFFLQIDSHADCVDNWDTNVIRDYNMVCNKTNNNKIVFSSKHFQKHDTSNNIINYKYAKEDRNIPLLFHNLTYRDGIPKIDTAPFYENHPDIFKKNSVEHLVKTQFLSAHFVFAGRSFIEQFRMSNYIVFFGEEPELSLRLFCEGFDIYTYYDRAIIIHNERFSYHNVSYNKDSWIDPVYYKTYDDKKEISKLFREGKNRFVSVLNKERTIKDFFDFHIVPEHRRPHNIQDEFYDPIEPNKSDDSPGHMPYDHSLYIEELKRYGSELI